jgi:hypothetical protein
MPPPFEQGDSKCERRRSSLVGLFNEADYNNNNDDEEEEEICAL